MPNGNEVATGSIPVSCPDGLSAMQDPQKSGFFLWKGDGRVSDEDRGAEKVQTEKKEKEKLFCYIWIQRFFE